MTIIIVPYNETWPEEFRKVAQPLKEAFGDLASQINHIGSTSVPGLAAKDIIDVQLTVADFESRAKIIDRLQTCGYTYVESVKSDHIPPLVEGPATDWEKLYFRPPADQRATHVHVRAYGRPNQEYPLLFRDYLRTHPGSTAVYALIKMNLSHKHPDDVEFYYDIKDPVCDLIIEAAHDWAKTIEWKMPASDL